MAEVGGIYDHNILLSGCEGLMLPEEYKIRCDKHQFKPFEYCEICWLRNEVQNAVETARKESISILAQTHLAIQVLNDCFDNLEKRIVSLENEIDYIKGHLVL